MAVPTEDMLLDYLNQTMDQYPGHLWDSDALIQRARAHFRTTTPAVRTRFYNLANQDRIARVTVDHSGLVYWRSDADDRSLPLAYLVEPDGHRSYNRFELGPVKLRSDIKERKNLWVNGSAWFFSSVEGYKALVDQIKQAGDEKNAAAKEKRLREQSEIRRILKEIDQDGVDLLKAMRSRFSNSHRVSLDLYDGEPLLNIMLSDAKDLAALFAILRSGLGSGGQEVAESS